MKMRFLFGFMLWSLGAFAQGFEFGKPGREEILMSVYPKDSSANAVVLRESGDARISNDDGTPLIFKYHVRIKLFNKQAFQQGDVVIPLYKWDNNVFEKVSDISAVTISTGPGGAVRKTVLDPKKVYRENKSKHWELLKFAMPDLSEGCIIEYSYELSSPHLFTFRPWVFQSDIPKISSEYTAHIPGIFNYNVTLRGPLKLTDTKSEIERECFTPAGGMRADCSKIVYSMTDIPALIEEDYMTSPNNFRSAINFELAEYRGSDGVTRKTTKEWKDIDYDLKLSQTFGDQLKKTDLFKSRLAPVLAGKIDALAKARAVYAYIQQTFKWNGFYATFSEDGIKKALETRSGNVADINLSLVTALSAAGLDAETVLLSTRENGIVNKLYPVVSDFNYLVAQVNIDDKSYLLDATDPMLPFGLLPIRCINDQGRVVSRDKPSYWIDLKASQKESRVYNLNLTLKEDGKLTGQITCFSLGYEAYNKRKAIKKRNSVQEYTEDLDEKMPAIRFVKASIDGVDSLEATLQEKYEVEIDAFSQLNQERFSFNPFFMDPVTKNPFQLKERTYPVDMGAPSDYRLQVTLTFPEKYEIIGTPQSVSIALPGGGGRYITQTTVEANQLVFSQLMQLNKPVYGPGEYPYLKEIFNKIVQTQKTDLVFRKKP